MEGRILEDKLKSEKINQNINEIPFFISHEYARLCDLAGKGMTAGALFETKDLGEVMLKFPVIISLSIILKELMEERDGINHKYANKIFENLVTKELGLGDWRRIAGLCRKQLGDQEEDKRILKNILHTVIEFYDNNSFVKWRNETIGHGALPFEDDVDFLGKFTEIVRNMVECLEKSLEDYKKVKIFCNDRQIKRMDDLLESDNKKLVVSVGENLQIQMEGFIIDYNYFFDSFQKRLFRTYYLDYLHGRRKSETLHLYRQIYEKYGNNSKDGGKNASAKAMTRGTDDFLRNMNLSEKYNRTDFLEEWISKMLNLEEREENHHENRGIFLLQMDRGMGKTAFVANLDPLIGEENPLFEECYLRVYYCSALGYRSSEDFVESVNNLFCYNRIREKEYKDTAFKKLSLTGDGSQLASVLGDVLEKVQEDLEVSKLVFVIDGLDEVNTSLEHSVFQFIPREDELPEDVYLILTCRNEDSEKLHDFTKRQLEIIKEEKILNKEHILDFSLKSKEDKKKYKKVLRGYLKKRVKNPENVPVTFQDELMEKADYRFLYYKLAVDLLNECVRYGRDYRMILNSDGIVNTYFSYVEGKFGEKLFKEAGRILGIIAISDVPLDLRAICFLNELRENNIPIYVLAILKTFDSLLLKVRTVDGTGYRLANEKYQEIIKEKFKEDIKNLVGEWTDYVCLMYHSYLEGTIDYKNKEIYDNHAEIFLHARIYRWIKEFNAAILDDIQICRELSAAILEYEQHLPAIQIGTQARYWDMDMSEAVIEICEDLEKEGQPYVRRVLAAAYNNYAYHYVDVNKDVLFKNANTEEAKEEQTKIAQYYDNAILKIAEDTETDEERKKIMLSKFYSGKGVYLNKGKNNRKEVESLFIKSYKSCLELLQNGVEAAKFLYLPAVIRVLDSLKTHDFKAAMDLFRSAQDEVDKLKGEKDEAALVSNLDRRVESGILYQEAQLYRKIAGVVKIQKTSEENGEITVKNCFEHAIASSEELLGYGLSEEEKYRVHVGYWVILYEYGKYLETNGENIKAKEQFDKAYEMARRLMEIGKLTKEGNTYLIDLLNAQKKSQNS